jgi:Saccharopine dehydrogenase C-terminal domain
MDGYSFVAYPNRNSVPFREFYNIPEAETVIRGSLMYKGSSGVWPALAGLTRRKELVKARDHMVPDSTKAVRPTQMRGRCLP